MPRKPSPVEEDEQIEIFWEVSPEVRGTSKKLLPPADIGQKEALKFVGQLLDESHYTLLLDETGTVGTPQDGPICTLLKNRIPKDLLDRARPAIRSAASQSVAAGKRVDAAGAGKGIRLRPDGSKTKITGIPRLEDMSDEDYIRLKSARDGTVGVLGGRDSRGTATSLPSDSLDRKSSLITNECDGGAGRHGSESLAGIHSVDTARHTDRQGIKDSP